MMLLQFRMEVAEKKVVEEVGEYKMAIKILKKSDNKVKFVLSKATPELANALRRAISFEVPVLAIEDVYFTKNSSALYDEIVAHRVGLIPLKGAKGYTLPDECKCKGKGCARCQTKAKLKVKGPATVLAKDLKFKDKSVKPVYPDMPIVKLLKNQELEFEATATLGKGKEHSKWSSGLAFYQRYPSIYIGQKDIKTPEKIVKLCPRNVYKTSGDRLVAENILDCNLCMACVDETKGTINVGSEEGKFIFTIESWGQLSPKAMLTNASKILKKQINGLKIR
ncbi:DNA-directed RNA polymerase subunit D [Candidatus Woesearchaeota archaeon]|nr:DNA-directed RNA polymerase subunit D [Candidatus Woesearchaeota archaeon]